MSRQYSSRHNFINSAIVLLAVLVGTAFGQIEPAAEKAKAAAQNPGVEARGNISSDSLTPKILEYWKTPSLEGSDLKIGDVIPGDVDTIDGVYTHEVTRVQWRPGDPIDLYIIKPVSIKNPPVILYLYSYPFETDRFLN